MLRRAPRPTLFPYTTLFRSALSRPDDVARRTEGEAEMKITIESTSKIVSLRQDRKSTRLNSSHANISYAVFCLKKKTADPRGPAATSLSAASAFSLVPRQAG